MSFISFSKSAFAAGSVSKDKDVLSCSKYFSVLALLLSLIAAEAPSDAGSVYLPPSTPYFPSPAGLVPCEVGDTASAAGSPL